MGISINVPTMKSDYSSLFSSLGSSAGSAASSNWLGDYAMIKNGSYGRLMKAYYAEAKASSTTTSNGKSNSSNFNDNILE